MDDGTHFKSLTELELEKSRLDRLRQHHGEALERHWTALKDPEVRGRLMRNAASDAFLSWRPARLLADLAGGGTITAALASGMFRRGGLAKRLFVFATSLAVPYLLQRAGPLSMEKLIHEVGTTIDRIRQRMNRTGDETSAGEDD